MAADVICRTELWTRLKSQQKRLYDDQATRHLAAYDPAMPWDAAIAAATMDADFWSKQFERKALKQIAEGKVGQPIHDMPSEAWAGESGEPRRKKAKRGGGARMDAYFYDTDVRRPDGRFYIDKNRKKFCQDFQCREPCPQGLSHNCEYCRGDHRTNACRQRLVPQSGWQQQGQHHGGKGKGKGKNKGKAKWQHRAW